MQSDKTLLYRLNFEGIIIRLTKENKIELSEEIHSNKNMELLIVNRH